MTDEERGAVIPSGQDAEHLRLLALFHYVVGGIMAVMACIPIFHLVIGLSIVTGALGSGTHGEPPPRVFGWMFVFIAAAGILAGWTLAACTVFAGRSIARRKRYLFCLVLAGVMAVTCMPFGTALGIFTIIVLIRPSVKEAFEPGARSTDPQPGAGASLPPQPAGERRATDG